MRLKEHGQDVLVLEKIPTNMHAQDGTIQSHYKSVARYMIGFVLFAGKLSPWCYGGTLTKVGMESICALPPGANCKMCVCAVVGIQ